MPYHAGKYRTIIDAKTGDILYCSQLIKYQKAQGNVYTVNGQGDRQMVNFPRALEDYDWPIPSLPSGFPDPWVDSNITNGNCVNSNLEHGHWENEGTNFEEFVDDGAGPAAKGIIQGDSCIFDPADIKGSDQQVVNLFYLCCYAHDFSIYLVSGNLTETFNETTLVAEELQVIQ